MFAWSHELKAKARRRYEQCHNLSYWDFALTCNTLIPSSGKFFSAFEISHCTLKLMVNKLLRYVLSLYIKINS